ncbi:ras GEF [Hesseltinella vesiculosa]|uniref:Ras GEF n=1 Tax=Hesseltinella vesiculosa TaxID=101127 RepID=A0A1X2G4D3_9FUNG|nr:ras GEF [Hesseltinella vesiculosa]
MNNEPDHAPISTVEALYDYTSQDPASLCFQQGEVIQVLAKLESGWWDGWCNGRRGWFPSNYVQQVPTDLPLRSLSPHPEPQPSHTDTAVDQEPFRLSLNLTTTTDDMVHRQDDLFRQGTGHSNWILQTTEDGSEVYYYNVVTKEMRYSLPPDAELPPSLASPTANHQIMSPMPTETFPQSPAYQHASSTPPSPSNDPPLPPNWTKKVDTKGRIYYCNLLTDESTWTLDNVDLQTGQLLSTTPTQPRSSMDPANTAQGPQPLTWSTLSSLIAHAIHDLKNTIKLAQLPALREKVVVVVHRVRLMLYVSNTIDKESSPHLKANKTLRTYHRSLLAALAKTVLSTKAVSGTWPQDDALHKLQADADQLLVFVRNFLSQAQDMRLEIFEDQPTLQLHPQPNASHRWRITTPGHEFTNQPDTSTTLLILADNVRGAMTAYMESAHEAFSGLNDASAVPDKVKTTAPLLVAQFRNLSNNASQFLQAVDDSPHRPSSKSRSYAPRQSIYNAMGLLFISSQTITNPNLPLATIKSTYRQLENCIYDVEKNIQAICSDLARPGRRTPPTPASRDPPVEDDDDRDILDAIYGDDDIMDHGLHPGHAINHTLPPSNASSHVASHTHTIHASTPPLPPAVPRAPSPPPTHVSHSHHQARPSNTSVASSVVSPTQQRPPTRESGFTYNSPPSSTKYPPSSSSSSYYHHTSSYSASIDDMDADSMYSSLHNHQINTTTSNSSNMIAGDLSSTTLPRTPKDKLAKFFGEDTLHKRQTVMVASQSSTVNDMASTASTMATNDKLDFLATDYSPSDIIFNMEGNVRGGTINALVQRLTQHDQLDSKFNTTFLLTYRSFCSNEQLFDALFARYTLPPPAGLTNDELEIWQEKKLKLVRLRVFNVIKSWLDMYYIEEEDRMMLSRLLDFCEKVVRESMQFGAEQLSKAITKRMESDDPSQLRKMKLNVRTDDMPPPIIPKNTKRLRFLEIDPLELARQLTIMDFKLYSCIKPVECLDKNWGKADSQHVAANIKASIEYSNQVTAWVTDSILSKEEIKKRSIILKQWIMVAEKCRLLHNFNTCMAILSAFDNSSVGRLKRTWETMSAKTNSTLAGIRHLMGANRNFNEYREIIHKVNPPCIPFLGIYLQDLTFVEDGNSNYLKKTNNLINFAKRMKTGEVIQELQQYQSTPYILQPVGSIQEFIKTHLQSSRDEETLYNLSLAVEPRERTDDTIARRLRESGL